jgi:hypothetical protein
VIDGGQTPHAGFRITANHGAPDGYRALLQKDPLVLPRKRGNGKSTAGAGEFPDVPAFRKGLEQNGLTEGRNLKVEYRWARGDYSRLPALAAELVGLQVGVLLAGGGDVSAAEEPATWVLGFMSARSPEDSARELADRRRAARRTNPPHRRSAR